MQFAIDRELERAIAGANKPFKQESLDMYTKSDAQEYSDGKTLYMSPDEFLEMATPLFNSTKEVDPYYSEQLESGNKMEVPYLSASYDGKTGDAKITEHEGRHRAETLRKKGTKLMPVRFRMIGREGDRFDDVFWKDLGNNKTEMGANIGKYPHRLFNQDGSASYSFPVNKKKVKANNIRYKLSNKTTTKPREGDPFNVGKQKTLKRIRNKRDTLNLMLKKATEEDWEWLAQMPQTDWEIYWDSSTESFNFPEVSTSPINADLQSIINS